MGINKYLIFIMTDLFSEVQYGGFLMLNTIKYYTNLFAYSHGDLTVCFRDTLADISALRPPFPLCIREDSEAV